MIPVKQLLQSLVLDGPQDFGSRIHSHPLILQLLQSCNGNMFDLNGQDIHVLSKSEHIRLIAKTTRSKLWTNLTGRKMRICIQDGQVQTPSGSCLTKHFTQLATTENTDPLCRKWFQSIRFQPKNKPSDENLDFE